MSENPYADSDYISERLAGADPALCCEPRNDDAEEGDEVKCRHCSDSFEVMLDKPKPCIERFAEELEALRAKVGGAP